MGPRPWELSSRLALVATGVATALSVVSAWGAWRIEPLPTVSIRAPDFHLIEALPPDTAVTAYAVLTATENNPFRPDRRRPEERYVPPALRRTAAQMTARPARFVPAFQLDGIAWTPGRPAVAILGVSGQSARLLNEGAEIESFRVQKITERSVTLVGADTTVVLELESGAAGRGSSEDRERRR